VKNLLAAFGVRVEKEEIARETGLRLRDKVAIVTGGDTGIGKAISLAMAREGARIVIDYHGERAPARALVQEIAHLGSSAHDIGADVSKPDGVRALIAGALERYGRVDIMVNNAGIEEQHPFIEMPLEVYEKTIAVNLTGTWLGCQLAAQQMVKQQCGGRIINISSIHEDVTMPTNAAYCASKGAIRMLTRTIAVELAPYGITVNDVCPGAIRTPIDASIEQDAEKMKQLLSEIPMRRMGRPDEVAQMCVYLASEDAAYVTGASFVIDGGMSKQSGSL
jgi:glucose 1-dehydrogenase